MRAVLLVLAISACRAPASSTDAGIPEAWRDAAAIASQSALMPTTPSLPLPADWPANVPIGAGAHISAIRVHANPDDSGVIHEIEYQTTATRESIIELYRHAFPSAKKTVEMSIPMTFLLQFVSPEQTIDIAVMSAMGVTQVSVTVGPPP